MDEAKIILMDIPWDYAFGSVVPMGKAFRKATGLAPGVWRKQFHAQ